MGNWKRVKTSLHSWNFLSRPRCLECFYNVIYKYGGKVSLHIYFCNDRTLLTEVQTCRRRKQKEPLQETFLVQIILNERLTYQITLKGKSFPKMLKISKLLSKSNLSLFF